MNLSKRFLVFFGISIVIFIANLLLTNDYTTFWNGAESDLLLSAANNGSTSAFLPQLKLVSVIKVVDFQSFMLRLPSVGILLSSLIGFWFFGKRVFGERTTAFTILVLMSSFLLPNITKWATADAWVFGSQLLGATTLILYLKKPEKSTLIACVLIALVGLFSNFYATTLFFSVLLAYWYFRHPQGKKVAVLGFLAVVLTVGVGLYFLTENTIAGTYLAPFELSLPKYLGFSLLGMLPWIAFLPAAIIDMFAKLKRKEEMSILTSGWLLAGLLSFSVGLQAAFAFLIAKQLQSFFAPNYPYTNWVKTFGVLNIVGAFVGGVVLMLNGFYLLEMEGFRLAMSIGAVYWVTGFLGVVGLMGKKNGMMMGGMAASGLLLTFFFWARVGPVLETFRSLPQELTNTAFSTEKTGVLYLFSDEEIPNNYSVQAKEKFSNVMTIGAKDLQSVRPTVDDVMVFYNEIPDFYRFTKDTKIDTLIGRKGLWEVEKWFVIKK